ncbi:MAG TPA: PEGA domain-containing protein, partial [Candidatus Angelobacter sp.]
QPFRGMTEEEVVNAILKQIPPPASEINPAVSQMISRVVHKAMAKQPWNRYDNAREFGDSLQKALRNEPIELFDPARLAPRIQRANKAFDSGDYQFAGEIVTELEAEGNIDPQISLLRTQIDQVVRQRTISQLLESARARFEEEEDPLALQKIQEILQLDPNHMAALGLKSKIEDRRSERQIDKWFKLASQHMENHAYSHARQALQNVLQLRPKENRATRLMADIEREEEDYLKLRKQKSDLYQNALNAWKNGDVSVALSQMGVVLDLDRRAPDTSSPELSGTYQSFYNKVRSEHDSLNNGYAEARRYLAERDFAKALKVCDDVLAKYPGQALFQAVKFDIEEQQRQQLSAFIADADRRLDSENDLDAKYNLLREALSSYPKEPHFERSLKLVSDKRDLVNSIVARSRTHEERGQINEALADMEVLRTIYSPYPGLQFEVERLEKRREQQSRDAAKAVWIEQIDRQLGVGEYTRALEVLQKAQAEFPSDAEMVELQKLAQQGYERSTQAAQLFADGQDFCAKGDFEQGLELIRKAHQLDDRNPEIRSSLRDLLVERARNLHDTDWQACEVLAQEALELDPSHPEAKSLRTQAYDRKREDFVEQCASQARRLQASGDVKSAAVEVEKGLSAYPSEPRLTVIRDTLNKELRQTQQKQARLSDLDQLKGLEKEAQSAKSGELQQIWERSRVVAERYPAEADVQSVAREVQRIVRARGGNAPTPKPKKKTATVPGPSIGEKLQPLLKNPALLWIAGAVVLVAVSAIGIHYALKPKIGVATVAVQIHTSPEGAAIRINGQDKGTSNQPIQLVPGEYQVEASLPGYLPITTNLSVKAGSPPPDVNLTLQSMAQVVRVATPDLVNGEVTLDDNPKGKLETGSLSLSDLPNGQHVLKITTPSAKENATVSFEIATGNLPLIATPQTNQIQAVLVSSKQGAAHVVSSLANAAVAVDGNPYGQLNGGVADLNGLTIGVHELSLGQGADLRKMPFEVGAVPALDAIFFSDRAVGSMLVLTGQPDAQVIIDGKAMPHKTMSNGQLRIPNLPTTSHTVSVAKDGFKSMEAQKIDVLKGQEKQVTFVFEPLTKPSSLSLEHMPAGAQVTIDGTQIGTIAPNGTLTDANISPGEHTLVFTQPGYPVLAIKKTFLANEPIRLSSSDINWKRSQATLDVNVAANTAVTVTRGNQNFGHSTGPYKFPLEEGAYTITTRTANGQENSQNISLSAGESRPLDMRTQTPAGDTMDLWSSKWTQQDQWYTHRGGGYVLYTGQRGAGNITFTVKMRKRNIFGSAPHIKWVVNFVDDRNYLLFELDNKSFYQTEVVNGNKQETKKTPYNLGNAEFIHLNIAVSANGLQQRCTTANNTWQTLTDWGAGTTTPSLSQNKNRNFAVGSFGFYLPGNDEIEISNFSYKPTR